jgi:hypothetical protein
MRRRANQVQTCSSRPAEFGSRGKASSASQATKCRLDRPVERRNSKEIQDQLAMAPTCAPPPNHTCPASRSERRSDPQCGQSPPAQHPPRRPESSHAACRTELNRETKLPAIRFAGQKRELVWCKSPMLNQVLGRPQLLHRSAPGSTQPGKSLPQPFVTAPSDGHFAQLRGHWADLQATTRNIKQESRA